MRVQWLTQFYSNGNYCKIFMYTVLMFYIEKKYYFISFNFYSFRFLFYLQNVETLPNSSIRSSNVLTRADLQISKWISIGWEMIFFCFVNLFLVIKLDIEIFFWHLSWFWLWFWREFDKFESWSSFVYFLKWGKIYTGNSILFF